MMDRYETAQTSAPEPDTFAIRMDREADRTEYLVNDLERAIERMQSGPEACAEGCSGDRQTKARGLHAINDRLKHTNDRMEKLLSLLGEFV